MGLKLISLPIGHPEDITLRALKALKECDVLIGEEAKTARQILLQYDLRERIDSLYFLNEHSTDLEIAELLELCNTKDVGIFSDCGTPSFCDPAYILVQACRRKNIPVTSLSGTSSLMHLLSLVDFRLDQFLFYGFLPQKTADRKQAWKNIREAEMPIFLMDTAYRYTKVMEELKQFASNKSILLGCDLTKETEWIYQGKIKNIPTSSEKKEFVALMY